MTEPIILPAKPIKEKKTYTIVNPDGTESSIYTGHQPIQAALKAAITIGGTKEAPKEFKIREKGTKDLHVFKGYVELIPTPEAQKKFIKSAMIRKAHVEKVCIEKVV